MPIFSDAPPTDLGRPGLRIIRTPAKGLLRIAVTSDQIVGAPTHFAGGRTVPCDGEGACKHCAEGLPWRWLGYITGILPKTREHVLFEFTARASEPLRSYRKIYGTLRGGDLNAQRPSGKTNGRVTISVSPLDLSNLELPSPPDIAQCLCTIWGIPKQRTVQGPVSGRPGDVIRMRRGTPPSPTPEDLPRQIMEP